MADNKGGAMMRKKIFPEYEPELTIGELKIDPMSYSVIYKGASVALTSKEFEVLYLLAQRPKFIFPKRIQRCGERTAPIFHIKRWKIPFGKSEKKWGMI